MSFVDKFTDLFREKVQDKSVGVFNASDQQDDKIGVITEWFYAAPYGIPRNVDIREIRDFGLSNWVKTIEGTIIKEVVQTEWNIVAKDDEDMTDYSNLIVYIKEFLNHPNRNGDTFEDICKPVLLDILELDSGVWVKNFGAGGDLVEIWCRDGGSFLKELDIHGIIKGYYQYSWRNPLSRPERFEPNEIIYFSNSPLPYKVYGFSPLMSAQQLVDLLIHATKYNKNFFQNNAIPDGVFSLVNANADTLKAFESAWNSQMKGKAHKLAFINSEIGFEKFNTTNKEMEWLEGMKWYQNMLCAVYGVSPAEIGMTEDVNRSTQAGQERVSVKNSIKPYLQLLQTKINNQIIPDLLKLPVEKCPVMFKYFPQDHVAELETQRQMLEEYKNQLITKNEYRINNGYDAVDDGDDFKSEPQGFDLFGSPRKDEKPDKSQVNQVQEDLSERRKSVLIKGFVEDKDQIIDESGNYSEWLAYKIGVWENKVLRAIETEDIVNKDVNYVKKTFGSFISVLFNAVNTATFYNGVKHFVKKPMKAGLAEAESELSVDIGISDLFEAKANFFVDQELNGYTLPDGKKWHGIKGASKELQVKILNTVSDGVVNKKSQSQIVADVKEVFRKAKEGQAERIARTETNRFVNEGKLTAYMDSGVKGRKVWKAHLDDTTSDVCRRLHGQKVGLTENFVDRKTSKVYPYPPSHPNCRSIIQFDFDEGES